jgi:hypothetical protein
MKYARELAVSTVVGGALVLVPIYLAVLLLLKGMQSVVGLVRPIAALLPDWLPGENLFSLLIVLMVCCAVGTVVRTRAGRTAREGVEKTFFGRLPGYALFRSLTQRMAGAGDENVWQPLAGAVHILSRERVHLVDIPFTQAIRAISRWGSGSGDMVAAMRNENPSWRRNAEPAA